MQVVEARKKSPPLPLMWAVPTGYFPILTAWAKIRDALVDHCACDESNADQVAANLMLVKEIKERF